jgi:ubiquinone/menaquinone biosynthesis C-methylase UbiE
MSFYSVRIFPCLCDWLLDRPFLAAHRRELLAQVEGEVLEIGVGTGLNLRHYPRQVQRIVTVDPNPGMNRRLARRLREAGRPVEQHIARGERLPFEEASFDFTVSTLTLCSLADVNQTLAEVVRVLKPGGRLLFFEHGLSPDPHVARRQRRWNWLQRFLADGCRLDLDVREAFQSQPFREIQIENFFLERTPATHGYIYRGAAVK